MTLEKKIVLFVWSVILLGIGMVSIFLIKQKDDINLDEIIITTALPDVKNFLTSTKVEEALKKEGIKLNVQTSFANYQLTQERVQNGTSDAKLDSHLPWSYFQSERSNQNPHIEVLMPLYFAKFAMYKLNSNDSDYTNLQSYLQNNQIKMLIPREETQQTLALRFLEKENLITRKSDNIDQKLETNFGRKRLFKLTLNDFTINNPNLKIDNQSDILNKEMINRLRKMKEDESYADIMLNYPGVVKSDVGPQLDDITVIKQIKLPEDKNDPIWAFFISLIVKKDKVNDPKINKLKEILSKSDILQFYWVQNKENVIGFEPNQLNQITQKINSYFVTN